MIPNAARPPRVSDIDASLGNVKNLCDSNAFQGQIAELLVYDAALSDKDVQLVEAYLSLKYWGKAFEVAHDEGVPKPKTESKVEKQDFSREEKPKQLVAAPNDASNFNPDDVFRWSPPETGKLSSNSNSQHE